MTTTISAGLRTGLPVTQTSIFLPPKLIEEDRRTFLAASSQPWYRSRHFQPSGWGSWALREFRIFFRSWTNWAAGSLRWALGQPIEHLAQSLAEDLRRRRYTEGFFATDENIRTASSTVMRDPLVTAAAAEVYLHYGHIRAARAIIDASILPGATKEDGWMAREDVAMLALISLYIDVHRKLDFRNALSVLDKLDAIFLRLDCMSTIASSLLDEYSSLLAFSVTRVETSLYDAHSGRIRRQREILNRTSNESSTSDDCVPKAMVYLCSW